MCGDRVHLGLHFVLVANIEIEHIGEYFQEKNFTFSALSNSASAPVESTFTRAPNILTLSVSMAIRRPYRLLGHQTSNRITLTCVSDEYLHVFQPFWRVHGYRFVQYESCILINTGGMVRDVKKN